MPVVFQFLTIVFRALWLEKIFDDSSSGVCLICSHHILCFRGMEWSEDHDVHLLREMVVSEVFLHKKGSIARGECWQNISDTLNNQKDPKFHIKDKRGVRERWVLLQQKHKAKNRAEEAASGIQVDDLTEKEKLIEDLIQKEESFASSTVKEKTDKENAEEVRLKAMERMGQTKKRKGSESDETAAKTTKRCAQPLIDFLQEKASAERELRQAELALRKEGLSGCDEAYS